MFWDGSSGAAPGSAVGEAETVRHQPVERDPRCKLKIGLALGGGAARGWSHIGVHAGAERGGHRA